MTGCQAELCASNVALPEHVRAGRTCSGKATLRTGRLAGWDTQHTSMSPPLLWRLGSCSASHTAVMVQAPARGLSAGLLLTHDAWHPHWTTLGPTPVKKDQEFARHRSAMVRLARGNAIGPSAERKPRIFHTVTRPRSHQRVRCSQLSRLPRKPRVAAQACAAPSMHRLSGTAIAMHNDNALSVTC